MDLFEEKMANMEKFSAHEQATAIEADKAACICGKCPTYTECARDKKELLFCILGKNPLCITAKKGCLCPACPITKDYSLIRAYFCVKGSEREQRSG